MGLRELLRWQWAGYAGTHRGRANLLLHLGSVPLFWTGTLLLVAGSLSMSGRTLTLAAVFLLVPVVVQGVGHKRFESEAPTRFTSAWNFLARLFLEQWITFPRYVWSGGWWASWRG